MQYKPNKITGIKLKSLSLSIETGKLIIEYYLVGEEEVEVPEGGTEGIPVTWGESKLDPWLMPPEEVSKDLESLIEKIEKEIEKIIFVGVDNGKSRDTVDKFINSEPDNRQTSGEGNN